MTRSVPDDLNKIYLYFLGIFRLTTVSLNFMKHFLEIMGNVVSYLSSNIGSYYIATTSS